MWEYWKHRRGETEWDNCSDHVHTAQNNHVFKLVRRMGKDLSHQHCIVSIGEEK